ncbi:hypothetical protein D6C78_10885 [Aureobasidium pullulans]|uniref:Uncharacterized protein n=1 Tax=Aureobasidium pullulans TaxID=5580 RepID=A0A4T0B910_AURPU|nr:hypothetical protein D6C78_10885 [Aureobasidium pullulans]
MALHQNGTTDLRAQILENWRYAQPDPADVVIITTFDSEDSEAPFGAMIAKHPSKGGDLLFKISACSSTQAALSMLLDATSKLVSKATAGKPVKPAVQKELEAVPSATDKKDHEKMLRWLINYNWKQLRSSNEPADLVIVSSRPTNYCAEWIVWAMQLGLNGAGETEELALGDLLYRISSWRTGF